jgi:tetratricopeptide (TPR) repeat protein
MFFPKLRKRAKWVFLFLAIAFAFGFVAFGVGAGGSGIGDYFAELFNRQPSSGQPSIEAAEQRVADNPDDLQARIDLASAYQTDGQLDKAIETLNVYLEKKPDDLDALQQLASLYLTKGSETEQRAAAIQASGGAAAFSQLLLDPSQPFGAAANGPITNLEQQRFQSEYANLSIEGQAAYTAEADTWDKIVKLQPDETSFLLELARAAQQANDVQRAIDAYEKFLTLAPDDPNADQIKSFVKQLKDFQKQNAPPGTDGNG